MLRRIIVPLVAAACLSCAPRRPELAPPAGPGFHSLSIRFSFRDAESRQSGRVLWRFDDEHSKFIFFTPLNQAGLELAVAGETAVLVNFAKRVYWTGDFEELLERLWGIGLPLSALRSMLMAGDPPRGLFAGRGIRVALTPGSGPPERVHLSRDGAELDMRVVRRERRPGRIVPVDYAGRYRAAGLETVLEK